MSNFKEVLFVSDESDPASSVDCYDLQIGTKIGMYPSGYGVVRGSLKIIGDEYFMSAEVCKPPLRGSSNIHIWSIDTRNQVKRIPITGEVTALSASDDNFYCVAGINNKIHVWNIASGQLLNVINYHHEPITKIVFWSCNYFVTSGADGLVAVWRLADVISKETGDSFGPRSSSYQEPFFSSSKHSLPVTDMFLSPGGNACRLFTVSADQNCHVFTIGQESGKFLLALMYDFVLTTVICDHLQRTLYVGTTCGKIILFPLEQCTGVNMRHVANEKNLVGHSGAIKALAISQEDDLMASGGDDKKVVVWNLLTKQQLHTCEMHGTVSNLCFHVLKIDFLTPGPSQKTIVSGLEKSILNDPDNFEIKLCSNNELVCDDDISILEDMVLYRSDNTESDINEEEFQGDEDNPDLDFTQGSDSEMDDEPVTYNEFGDDPVTVDYKRVVKLSRQVVKLKMMNRRLKRINKKLYVFGLEQVWQYRQAKESTS